MNPSEEYKTRLEARNKVVEHCRKLDHQVGNARLAAGGLFFLVLGLAIGPHVLSGFWMLVPIAGFVVLVIRHERVRARGRQAQRSAAFYERGLARIEDRWIGTGDPGRAFFDESHPYTVDLDIFGKSSLFELLSSARTRSGEQTLAAWLKAPAPREEILQRQQAVDELRNNIDLREDLAVIGDDVRAAIHPEWMKRWGTGRRILEWWPGARIIAPLLSVLMIGSLVYYFGFNGSGWAVVGALSAGGAFGLHFRNRVREVTDAAAEPGKDLELLALVLARIEKEEWKSEKLRGLRAVFETDGHLYNVGPTGQEVVGAKRKRGSAQPQVTAPGFPGRSPHILPSKSIRTLVLLIEWLNSRLNPMFAAAAPFFLWATQFAFAIESWRLKHGPSVGPWLDAVGEIEALCSLAAYAFEHPDDKFPEILESGTRLEGESMCHPLLPALRCIANSIELDTDRQILIISGSNMSGKSTLLRTVGVNAVLALAGAPVRAKRMKLSILSIGATIRVQDSLQGGTSRFYAEIQRLRDIMELTKRGPVLFLLDEILHGTNSHDRAVGAEAVIRGLINHGAIGLVTTHDLALARLADALAPRGANFHFQDELKDGKMFFDYRLHPGVVQKSNALALMRAVGLEV